MTARCALAIVTMALAIGTLAQAQQPQVGRVICISPNGDDSAAGTAEAPRRSVQKALDEARPGDVVRLLPGVHRGRVSFTHGGQYGKPIVLEGVTGAVIDGSEAFEPQWQPAPDVADGVYRASVPFIPRTVVVDGKVLTLLDENRVVEGKSKEPIAAEWKWQTIFNKGITDRGTSRWEGVRGLGLYLSDRKELLVRLQDKQDPRKVKIALAPHEPVVRISGVDRCVVRGLELRNAQQGVLIERSLGSVVEQCDIESTVFGVLLERGTDRATIRFNTITQNPYSDYVTRTSRLSWYSWLAHKVGGFSDTDAILMNLTVGGHEIHDNYIHDHFDGIESLDTPPEFTWTEPADVRMHWARYNQNLNVHHNRIERFCDDGLEPNDAEANGRWHDNLVAHGSVAFRVKTIDLGPLYIYRNIFVDNGLDIRFFGWLELNPAEVYVYHNSSTARRAVYSNQIHGIGLPNFHVYNNLFWAEGWWARETDQDIEPNWKSDYNVYVRRGADSEWEAGRAMAQRLKMDANSRWIDDRRAPYAAADRDDLSLTEQSPARGAGTNLKQLLGRTLPGLEDQVDVARPDAGALWYGQPMPHIPRDPASVKVIPAGFWPEPE